MDQIGINILTLEKDTQTKWYKFSLIFIFKGIQIFGMREFKEQHGGNVLIYLFLSSIRWNMSLQRIKSPHNKDKIGNPLLANWGSHLRRHDTSQSLMRHSCSSSAQYSSILWVYSFYSCITLFILSFDVLSNSPIYFITSTGNLSYNFLYFIYILFNKKHNHLFNQFYSYYGYDRESDLKNKIDTATNKYNKTLKELHN